MANIAENYYYYNGHTGLTSAELFFWVTVDKTLEQLGVKDVGAVIAVLIGQPNMATRLCKPIGATKGTSLASLAGRRFLNYNLKFRLPMITGSSIRTLRIALTKNLGAFVGRSVPIVGWVILGYDVTKIIWNTVTTYNTLVHEEDRVSHQ